MALQDVKLKRLHAGDKMKRISIQTAKKKCVKETFSKSLIRFYTVIICSLLLGVIVCILVMQCFQVVHYGISFLCL